MTHPFAAAFGAHQGINQLTPARVWLDWPEANRGDVVYDEPPERATQPGQTEYIRADLSAARIADLERQLAEAQEEGAQAARLREALTAEEGPDLGAPSREPPLKAILYHYYLPWMSPADARSFADRYITALKSEGDTP
jgi:glycine/D-amino acid oxidase-like deaminating enzyme